MTLQSDPAWIPERRGCLTASRMRDAMDFLKNGKESEARRRYKVELVAERVTGIAVGHLVTKPMQRGLDFEAAAKARYEEETGLILAPAVFIQHPTIENFGATPDSPPPTSCEFKVPLMANFVQWCLGGEIPADHLPQLWAQMACCGDEYKDFVAYCPEMPYERQLFVRRLRRDEKEIKRIEDAAKRFLAEVDEMFEKFTRSPMEAAEQAEAE